MVWSLAYDYPPRYVHCWVLSSILVTHGLAALGLTFQQDVALFGHTPSSTYTDVTVAMLEVDLHQRSAWGRVSCTS